MKPRQIIIWGGWYGSKNVGDQALLLAITDLLGSAYPDARFIVLTSNAAHVHHYTSRDSTLNIRAINTRKEFTKVISAFKGSDLFIFGGAVPFFDNPPQVATITILTGLARWFNIPYFLWSVSSQRIKSSMAKAIFGWVLRGAGGITCRDVFTRQLFMDCGIPEKEIRIGGDSVILMQSGTPEAAMTLLKHAGWSSEHKPLVALTPRTLRTADGEAETHYTLQSSDQFQKEINVYAVVLDWLWEHGYQPLFVPMNTVHPDDDRLASRMIMERAQYGNHALIIDEEIYPRDASGIYAQCQLSLVSRVHGSILSFKAGCPVVMYAFDQKHIGIMQEMGLADFVFRPELQDANQVIDLISKILRDDKQVRANMADLLEASREKSMIPFREALRLLEKGNV
jgi:polysaccharide pyruvyl transferase WcaK-like protein